MANADVERTYIQGPCSGPCVVHLLASRSLAHQLRSSRVWKLRSSGFSYFVAFGAPFLSLLTPAGAAVPVDDRGNHRAVLAGRVRNSFIKIGMKLSLFIKNHFHHKPLSSKTTFIKNHFHQKRLFSNTVFIRSNFHPNHFHPNNFRQNPISSKTIFIKKNIFITNPKTFRVQGLGFRCSGFGLRF